MFLLESSKLAIGMVVVPVLVLKSLKVVPLTALILIELIDELLNTTVSATA